MNCRSNRHRWLVWLTLWVFGLAALAPAISRALWAAEHPAVPAHAVVASAQATGSHLNDMHRHDAQRHGVRLHDMHRHDAQRHQTDAAAPVVHQAGHRHHPGHGGHAHHHASRGTGHEDHESHEGHAGHDGLTHLDHCALCVVMAHLPPVSAFLATAPVVAFTDIPPASPVQADLAQRHILPTLSRGPPAAFAAPLARAA